MAAASLTTATTIQCNATLEAGSTLQLTDKLDLSGRDPAPDLPWPCAMPALAPFSRYPVGLAQAQPPRLRDDGLLV